jgi:uncharacterized membrane protein
MEATHVRDRVMRRSAVRPGRVNVGDVERLVSVVGGGALALYGLRRGSLGGAAAHRGVTGHSRLYQMTRIRTADEVGLPAGHAPRPRAITIELYRFWRDFENLPQFMKHLLSVRNLGPAHSHWVTGSPGGGTMEWDAEIVDERENALIAWRTLDGADVAHAGEVRFDRAPGDRGTEVTLILSYDAPGGKLGAIIARLLGREPGQQVEEDLRSFKQMMEASEIPTTAGQPSRRVAATAPAAGGSR